MKYEICKEIKDKDGDLVWSVIAWSDIRTYADDILHALNIAYDEKFAILVDGKVFKV